MTKFIAPFILCALVLMGAGCTDSLNFFSDDEPVPEVVDDSYEDYIYEEDDYDYSLTDGLESEVEAPLRVSIGERFEIVATVTNNTTEDQLIHSIDISADYLFGSAIVSSLPDFSQSFLLDDGTMTHFFEKTVPAGETYTITFEMEALVEGDHMGAFDICFYEGFSCSYMQIRTVNEL